MNYGQISCTVLQGMHQKLEPLCIDPVAGYSSGVQVEVPAINCRQLTVSAAGWLPVSNTQKLKYSAQKFPELQTPLNYSQISKLASYQAS